MHKDSTAEKGIAIMDHRDVEQICLSWHLIKESDSNYKENMAVVLDKRISAVLSRVMRDICPDIPAHTRAIVMQLDMMVHCSLPGGKPRVPKHSSGNLSNGWRTAC
ncbi:hypothetical protein IV203_004402 [Nitzschia inconspicua]|uniref:Uncharacterized protein n=1 Tax=Nitzschia inconspicua TaxID=303405 RepID=A0A9K3PQ34_9STRA|nr:hypothetical protein IV203_004402 [Nitzschia inconspicua]